MLIKLIYNYIINNLKFLRQNSLFLFDFKMAVLVHFIFKCHLIQYKLDICKNLDICKSKNFFQDLFYIFYNLLILRLD